MSTVGTIIYLVVVIVIASINGENAYNGVKKYPGKYLSSFTPMTTENVEKKANESRRAVFNVSILFGLFFLLLYFSLQPYE